MAVVTVSRIERGLDNKIRIYLPDGRHFTLGDNGRLNEMSTRSLLKNEDDIQLKAICSRILTLNPGLDSLNDLPQNIQVIY